MTTGMDFCLLGPLMVRQYDVPVPALPAKQRVLLATLLLSANQVVSLDELAEAMWGSTPPKSARGTLRNYVKSLRKVLPDLVSLRIRTQPGGYLCRVQPGELDVDRFGELLSSARASMADGAFEQAADQLRQCLALWRGEPLADVSSDVLVRRERPRLTEMRLQALDARIEANLQLGNNGEVIAELRKLTVLHPLRERFYALLMLALYRDGQQAAALAAYQHARRILVDELATEPGPELRQLEQQILVADPVLSAPAMTQRREPTEHRPRYQEQRGAQVPRQLPAAVRHFTGRVRELMTLTRMSSTAAPAPGGGVMISVISGTAGVGKTALAVQWAHMAAGRFPDGQLFVNLRGYDPAGPVSPADALAGFLRGLGVPGQNIPSELDELAGQFRSVLADRRVLVVLDNAASVDQVRPLLPGGPGCAALITSRACLPGLVAADGAQRLNLDPLPLEDAIEILRALVGDRIINEPQAAQTLADQCARLPLALRLTAELAASHPDQRLADLAADLANEELRFDRLDADGDTRAGLRAVLSSSYQSLDVETARAFRLAGLVPGPDFDAYALAALTGAELGLAQSMLQRLEGSCLLYAVGPGRYAMHDLLRAYARELVSAVSQAGATSALFDHYLHTAASASDTLFPSEASRHPCTLAPASPAPPVATHDQARGWLDAERANLVAAAARMACDDWHTYATRLAAILTRYLDAGGYYQEAIAVHGYASQAASLAGDMSAEAQAARSLGVADFRQGHYQRAASFLRRALALFLDLGDTVGEARALHDLSLIDLQTGRRYAQAADQLERAFVLFRAIGDQPGQARALGNLGLIDMHRGRYERARHNLRQAVELCQSIGDRPGQARALSNLGVIEERQGRWLAARGYLDDALAACREVGDRAGEADVLRSLGVIDSCLGNHLKAVGHLQHALALSAEIGERRCQGWALTGLGLVSLRQRQLPQAAGFLQQALELYQATGDESGEAEAFNGLGEVLLASGEPEDASIQHLAALSRAERTGERLEFARANYGLACAYREIGKLDQARCHLRQALDVFRDLDAPQAAEACVQLAALDSCLGIGPADTLAARGSLTASRG